MGLTNSTLPVNSDPPDCSAANQPITTPGMDFSMLPVECISSILSFTSPKDACRSAAVCPSFRSAADSDEVWRTFLPPDYREIVSQSPSSAVLNALPLKDLYLRLCRLPVLLRSGNSMFAMERESGRKCYTIGARDLVIIWGDTPEYWTWKSLPESRFSEVAELNFVCWLDIKGTIEATQLTPKTAYSAYLVFKFAEYKYGFHRRPVELRVHFEGAGTEEPKMVVLDPPEGTPKLSTDRADGWMEIEMGEILIEDEDDGAVVFSLIETDDYTSKCGLIVEGIEIRPKHMAALILGDD